MYRETNYLANSKNSGAQNLQIDQAIKRYKELAEFEFEPSVAGSGLQVKLVPPTEKGMRFTYRVYDTDYSAYQGVRYYQVSDEWLIDLTTNIIDLTTKTGGMVDGSIPQAPVANRLFDTDYLIWGFTDISIGRGFVGFGVTRRPQLEFNTITAVTGVAGAKGSTTRFNYTLSANFNALRFPIGSRVHVLQGVGAVRTWNYGTVFATTTTTIDLLLDNDTRYGTALLNAAGGVAQISGFKPLTDAGTVYEGYQYNYVGSLTLDSATNILYYRHRGNDYYHPRLGTTLLSVTTPVLIAPTALVPYVYLPEFASAVDLWITSVVSNNSGRTTLFLGPTTTLLNNAGNQSTRNSDTFPSQKGTVLINKSSYNIAYSINFLGPGDCTHTVSVIGYRNEKEF